MYALGLLSDGERKSMEPIAARVSRSADRTHATHEKLIHFLGASPWSDALVRAYAARYAVDAMTSHGSIRTWVIDDTGFLKQEKLSPGVQREYTGRSPRASERRELISVMGRTDLPYLSLTESYGFGSGVLVTNP